MFHAEYIDEALTKLIHEKLNCEPDFVQVDYGLLVDDDGSVPLFAVNVGKVIKDRPWKLLVYYDYHNHKKELPGLIVDLDRFFLAVTEPKH